MQQEKNNAQIDLVFGQKRLLRMEKMTMSRIMMASIRKSESQLGLRHFFL
jgi:hypothetical protein